MNGPILYKYDIREGIDQSRMLIRNSRLPG
jgi:hypothetical protein